MVALTGVAVVIAVNAALYRAGRDRPELRRAHGWFVLVAPMVIAAVILVPKWLAPAPPVIVDADEFASYARACQVRDVRWTHGEHYDVDLLDGTRLHTTQDVSAVWAATDC